MKIYVATSWRNPLQHMVVRRLREAGHKVYDFKNPTQGNNGFHWSEVKSDLNQTWQGQVTAPQFVEMLNHPLSKQGFDFDMDALKEADACVLLLPSGRSAHLEAGYAVGSGKPTVILLSDENEPELMYKMADVVTTVPDVIRWAEKTNGAIIR